MSSTRRAPPAASQPKVRDPWKFLRALPAEDFADVLMLSSPQVVATASQNDLAADFAKLSAALVRSPAASEFLSPLLTVL